MVTGRYYVVWIGREPGIYREWAQCRAQVDDFPGALYRTYPSAVEAQRAWVEAGGEPIPLDEPEQPDETASPWGEDGPAPGAIAVDAACSGNPGPMEYRGVEIDTGEQLFLVGPMLGNNNLGEFLAVVHGLAWQKAKGRSEPIYSDSRTALDWVRRGRVSTTLERTPETAHIWQLVDRAHHWLHHEAPGVLELRKWPTRRWGEIPADFGRK